MNESPEAEELRYLRAYQGFIYEFNMLERNIAYCLAFAVRRTDETATIESFLQVSFEKKVRKLKALVKQCGFDAAFQEFFFMIENCRLMRNKIVHGCWEFRDFLDGPIQFHIPAPTTEKGSYTLDSFESELKKFEAANATFSELRKKHDLRSPTPNEAQHGTA